MDNCLLSDSRNLPLWYVKVLSFFPSFRTYNNFYNNSNYNLYQLITPKYGFYSLKNIYDIFNYHSFLKTQNIKLVKYEFNIITIFEYNKKTSIFEVVKLLDNTLTLDEDLQLLIDSLISNNPKIIVTEQILIGILYALKIEKLYYPNLQDKLNDIDSNKFLKNYKQSTNYDFIYHAFEDLMFKYGIHEKPVRNKNLYKIEFNLPDTVLLSNLVGGDNSLLQDFKNGKVKSNKKEIMYNSIILCILFSRFCKNTNFNKKPFSLEFIIKIYLEEFDNKMKEDIIMMIKILEIEKLIFKENSEYQVSANFEDLVHKFFLNSSYWWSINVDKSEKVIEVTTNIKNMNDIIQDLYDNLEEDNVINVLCHSGCDKTFIEEVSKYDKSLLFIYTLSSLYSSNNYTYSTFSTSTDIKYFKDIKLNYDVSLKLYMDGPKPKVDIGCYTDLNLTSIFSNIGIINNFNPSETIVMNYNINRLKFKIMDLIKLDISHYFIYLKDAISNNYLLYTLDPNFKLLCHLHGCNFIYENIKNGKRYLKMFTENNSDFSL